MSLVILKIKRKRDIKEKLNEAFEKISFKVPKKVFIKPNFSGRPPLIPGENTNPLLLKMLILFLLEKGASKIIVGHNSLLNVPDNQYSFDTMIKRGGFSFLYKMPSTTVLNLNETAFQRVDVKKNFFFIPKIIKEVDAYINLAKIKTHMETTVTLSLKNQMGLVSAGDRINMHRGNLEKLIAYLGMVLRPTINIIEGMPAMEGNGPHHGTPKNLDLIILGRDMVELDSAICYLIGVPYKEVTHISIAKEIGVGNYPSNETLTLIDRYKTFSFKKAEKFERFGRCVYVWPTTACSRCITALNESGKIIKKHPIKNFNTIKKIFVGKEKINIVIGKADNLNLNKKEKIICIGKCSVCFAKKHGLRNLNQCPPTIKDVLEYINKELK